MDAQHKQLVAGIAEKVRSFYEQKEPFRIYHGSTNSTRVQSFDRDKMIDASGLNRVLQVNTAAQTATVEPNVPMDALVKATLRHGLLPPVVMEFPGITVGGGLQGGAGESSSFKWGTFNRTLNWYEIILANGELLRVSPSKHPDLFWGGAGSYGSLGVVTAAEVQLIPARRYVELTYIPVTSFTQATETIARLIQQQPDFIDGIMYAKDCGVVMAGTLTDAADATVCTFSRAGDDWFYMHAERIARRTTEHVEAIPLKEYLFRYDRGAFWMGKYAFSGLRTPNNRFTRWLLDPLLHTRRMYDALQASGASQEFIIQDLALPAEQAVPFMQYIDKAFGIYPLWLCPLLPETNSPLLSSNLPAQSVINIGVWGHYSKSYDKVVAANKKLEARLKELHGKKWLYAYAYYSEEQFWDMYDKEWYLSLRRKYHAETLPTLYDKTCNPKRYPVSTKKGVLHALLGRSGIRMR
jgi:Delta24-sterol reductase